MGWIPKNPLKYWCAPNGATPEYVAHTDLYNFLAFALMEHAGPGWSVSLQQHKKFAEFVRELQFETLNIFEKVLSGIETLVDANDLDGEYTYGPDDFGVQDHTTQVMLTEEEAEKDPGHQIEYSQNVSMRYEEDGDLWVVLFEYGVIHEDQRGIWWHVKMDEDGWLERYIVAMKKAREDLSRAWQIRDLNTGDRDIVLTALRYMQHQVILSRSRNSKEQVDGFLPDGLGEVLNDSRHEDDGGFTLSELDDRIEVLVEQLQANEIVLYQP